MANAVGDLWVTSGILPEDLQDEDSSIIVEDEPTVDSNAPIGVTVSTSGDMFVCFSSELPDAEVNGFWVRAFAGDDEIDRGILSLEFNSFRSFKNFFAIFF